MPPRGVVAEPKNTRIGADYEAATNWLSARHHQEECCHRTWAEIATCSLTGWSFSPSLCHLPTSIHWQAATTTQRVVYIWLGGEYSEDQLPPSFPLSLILCSHFSLSLLIFLPFSVYIYFILCSIAYISFILRLYLTLSLLILFLFTVYSVPNSSDGPIFEKRRAKDEHFF